MADLIFLTNALGAIVENLPSNQFIEVHFMYNNFTGDVRFYEDKSTIAANIIEHCGLTHLNAIEFLTKTGYYYKLIRP